MDHDKKELSHQPVPGYRLAFYLIFGASLAYLTLIFVMA
jgi:hypothetical protein